MNFLAVLLAFMATLVLLHILRPLAAAAGFVDVPGGRKTHEGPVPLIGGICMSLGLGFGAAFVHHPAYWDPALIGIYLLVVVGTIDDLRDIGPNVRLVAQCCAALVVVFASGVQVTSLGSPVFFLAPLGIMSAPFTLLFIMTLTNAFNMVDGTDGLAGGLAFISLISMGILAVGTDVFWLIWLLVAVVGAFLLLNLPLRFIQPFRTFMGDAGSTFLGLSIGTVGICLSQGAQPRLSPVIGLWLVAVPVFELFCSIIRRVRDGKSPLAPDHGHLHHLLINGGLSRGVTLVLMLALAAVCAAIGIAGHVLRVPDGLMLIVWFAGGVAYFRMLRRPAVVLDALLARTGVRAFDDAIGIGRSAQQNGAWLGTRRTPIQVLDSASRNDVA
jgi:UDP-GlcNAc:undecaprenyl-phosphate GlcNAc-1-phosphate transferase